MQNEYHIFYNVTFRYTPYSNSKFRSQTAQCSTNEDEGLILRHRTTIPRNSTQSAPDRTSTQPVLNPDISFPYHFEFKIRVIGFVVQIAFFVDHWIRSKIWSSFDADTLVHRTFLQLAFGKRTGVMMKDKGKEGWWKPGMKYIESSVSHVVRIQLTLRDISNLMISTNDVTQNLGQQSKEFCLVGRFPHSERFRVFDLDLSISNSQTDYWLVISSVFDNVIQIGIGKSGVEDVKGCVTCVQEKGLGKKLVLEFGQRWDEESRTSWYPCKFLRYCFGWHTCPNNSAYIWAACMEFAISEVR